VLGDVSDRLAATGWAPLAALADMSTADVLALWAPFEQSVRRQARSSGLIRPRVPVVARRIVQAGAVAAAVLAYLAVHARPHAGHIWPLVAGYLALALPLGLLHRLSRTDPADGGRRRPGCPIWPIAGGCPARWRAPS
jgi:hypothetical protein